MKLINIDYLIIKVLHSFLSDRDQNIKSWGSAMRRPNFLYFGSSYMKL
jgi:hypothetical protein